MTYEVYRYIFIGGAILAGVMLLTSVLLFIFLHIPTVIGDLTGANARKAIENIRNQNASTGEKTYKSSYVNQERGKLTDKISQSGQVLHHTSASLGGGMATAKISTQILDNQGSDETTVLNVQGSNETTVLNPQYSNETTVLSPQGSNETTVLNPQYSNETTVLSPAMGETASLAPQPVVEQQAEPAPQQAVNRIFEIEYDITYIHSNEVIA